MNVTKAVIPCAGFGTRFLPITKVVPKELMPIVDVPALQYIVDEAVKSGIKEILLIISPQKRHILRYFRRNIALNTLLLSNHKMKEYALANPKLKVKISYAVQRKMDGNGMAVYLAREFSKGEPFAVLFGDDVMYTDDGEPVTKQLIDAYERTGKNIIGCQKMPEEVLRRCGVMKEGARDGNVFEVNGIAEKPQGELPGTHASLGRFILTADVFNALERTEPTPDGEIYLTSALDLLAAEGKVAACEFSGRRYDIGNKEGFLEATVEYALRDPVLGEEFAAYLKKVKPIKPKQEKQTDKQEKQENKQ